MSYDRYEPEDRDAPRPEDVEGLDYDDDEDGGRRCPICGRAVYAGAPKCPYCGEWFTGQAETPTRLSGWLWSVIVALLIAVILVMWHGLGR